MMVYYNFTDLYLQGEDGEVFEIMQSPVEGYAGKKVVVKQLKDSGAIVVKEFGTYHDDDSESLVKPYGAITGAVYRKVEKDQYTQVSLLEVMDGIAEYEDEFFLKVHGEYIRFNQYTSLNSIGIFDIEDLSKAKFYKKRSY